MASQAISARLVNAWKKAGGTTAGLRTQNSLNWFYTYIKKNFSKVHMSQIKNDGVYVSYPKVGQLVTYRYDPKHKATLPIYDTFPLVLITSVEGYAWRGINLHYVPPRIRMWMLMELARIADAQMTENQRLKVTYNTVRSFLKSVGYIKMYLADHLYSPILNLDYYSWEMVAFLPTQRWVSKD